MYCMPAWRAWARLARQAGMQYMVMTTKHHEGFCLWDTQQTDYNAVRRGPGRDLVREYVDACREFGLKIGFYYSLMDWRHPDGARCFTDPAARPLLQPYPGGDSARRYYQDAAIRAVLERIAQGGKRALLSLATGAGKTFIAVQLLKRIADAGQLKRALFVCDRDELRSQGLAAFQNVFGADAAEVARDTNGLNKARNARIHVATYQTLDVDTEDATANFLTTHYPENYFSHIVIDECHRSAWGRWSQVLTRNPDAVQIGLTATPRELVITERSKEAQADAQISADNLKHFGKPVYEYDLSQGIEDGYLAACEIHRFDLFLDNKPANERDSGVTKADLKGKKLVDADTGAYLTPEQAREHYAASELEDRLLLPERVSAMTQSLFEQMLATGTPE